MIVRAETPQLHLLAVLDLLRVAVAPFDGHLRISIGIDEDVEGAVPVENGKEGHRRRDLSEDCLDLFLDLFLCLFLRWRCMVHISGISQVRQLCDNRVWFSLWTYPGPAFSLSTVFREGPF